MAGDIDRFHGLKSSEVDWYDSDRWCQRKFESPIDPLNDFRWCLCYNHRRHIRLYYMQIVPKKCFLQFLKKKQNWKEKLLKLKQKYICRKLSIFSVWIQLDEKLDRCIWRLLTSERQNLVILRHISLVENEIPFF